MRWRRAGLVIAPALLALGCLLQGDGAAAAEISETPAAEASPALAARASEMYNGQVGPVPEKLLGTWVYSHEECELDSEMTPSRRALRAAISFDSDRTYRLDVEGFHFEGTYRYTGGESQRITLDSMLNFVPEGATLQNWSEGDAVYQCGRVFVREK